MEPLGFPADQVGAIQALGNIQQTVEAADARVQQAGDQVILTLQEALNQSLKTNQDLAGRLSLALGSIEALKKRIEMLETHKHAETMAHGKVDRDIIESLIRLNAETIDARNAYFVKRWDQFFK
jgi:hypothetical protein